MKTLFFLTALTLGMILGVSAYIAGGVVLMTTGFTFTFVIVGSVFVMVNQVSRTMNSDGMSSGGLAAST